MYLNDLKIGKTATVLKINTTNYKRLLNIGLIPNTKVKCLYKSPFGDIKAYLIRSSIYAIRNKDANLIEVFHE